MKTSEEKKAMALIDGVLQEVEYPKDFKLELVKNVTRFYSPAEGEGTFSHRTDGMIMIFWDGTTRYSGIQPDLLGYYIKPILEPR